METNGSVMTKLLCAICILAAEVVAQDRRLQFDGETFVQQFTKGSPAIGSVVEYVRPAETVKDWTRLIAIRNFPTLTDPKRAVADLARTVKQHNPRARHQILAKDNGTEAQIDFLTWTPKTGSYGEFNIHRYLKVDGYPGLISYQFAYRFSTNDANAVEIFKKNRERWLREMAAAKFEIPFRK
jgi:hypothetical protein